MHERNASGGVAPEAAPRQPRRPDVERADPGDAVAARADRDLSRAAADVDDGDAARGRKLRKLPQCTCKREPPFLGRREKPHRNTGGLLDPFEQLDGVRRLPAGARDEHLDAIDAMLACPAHVARDAGGDLVELRAW